MKLISSALKGSVRFAQAASGGLPIKAGETDVTAVRLLQVVLLQLGFLADASFPNGPGESPDGDYKAGTKAAVKAFQKDVWPEDPHQWDGDVGPNTIFEIDRRLAELEDIAEAKALFPATLRLIVQPTATVVNDERDSTDDIRYFERLMHAAEQFLHPFHIELTSDFSVPTLPINYPTLVRSVYDMLTTRIAAEHMIPESRDRKPALRVILCHFGPELSNVLARTPGLSQRQFEPFVCINLASKSYDPCILLHEMIHSTKLWVHDTNPASVFYATVGNNADNPHTLLSERYAKMLCNAFFAEPT